MKLYLIRHGETVDNVAGLYAGVRDSALTNHGFEQAQRLGKFFAVEKHVRFTHIFASPLQRALKTAEAVQKAQKSLSSRQAGTSVEIVKVPELMERDFGYYEGKPFGARPPPEKSGVVPETEKARKEPGFADAESKEAMAKRSDKFLDENLVPLLASDSEERGQHVVAVVAHGMLLSHLWRRLLLRLPRRSLTIAPEILATRGDVMLEYLGAWSNTGYLELALQKDTGVRDVEHNADSKEREDDQPADVTSPPTTSPPMDDEDVKVAVTTTRNETVDPEVIPNPTVWKKWSTTILAVDSKQHLIGLRRQRGGIGSSAHDEGQRKLDGFFKRQKLS